MSEDWNTAGTAYDLGGAMQPGLATRAFGLFRMVFAGENNLIREASAGYFNRPLGQASGLSFVSAELRAQPADRDNLFLGNFINNDTVNGDEIIPEREIDLYQLAP